MESDMVSVRWVSQLFDGKIDWKRQYFCVSPLARKKFSYVQRKFSVYEYFYFKLLLSPILGNTPLVLSALRAATVVRVMDISNDILCIIQQTWLLIKVSIYIQKGILRVWFIVTQRDASLRSFRGTCNYDFWLHLTENLLSLFREVWISSSCFPTKNALFSYRSLIWKVTHHIKYFFATVR
jgi:hypothetical protein